MMKVCKCTLYTKFGIFSLLISILIWSRVAKLAVGCKLEQVFAENLASAKQQHKP